MAKKVAKKTTKRTKRKVTRAASLPSIGTDKRYQVENDADTLMRAGQIRNDPAAYKKAQAALKQRERIIKKETGGKK